jgi:hypothetical protein
MAEDGCVILTDLSTDSSVSADIKNAEFNMISEGSAVSLTLQ